MHFDWMDAIQPILEHAWKAKAGGSVAGLRSHLRAG